METSRGFANYGFINKLIPVNGWPVDERVQIVVVGAGGSTGDEADGSVVDDVQFIEKIWK